MMTDVEKQAVIAILRQIEKPSGAYRIDPLEYRNNVIESCIKLTKEALKILNEPVEEG